MSATMARPRLPVINRWEEEEEERPEMYPPSPEDDVPGMTRETTILTEPDDDFFAAKQPTLPSVREEEALQDGNDLYEMRADSRYSFTNPPRAQSFTDGARNSMDYGGEAAQRHDSEYRSHRRSSDRRSGDRGGRRERHRDGHGQSRKERRRGRGRRKDRKHRDEGGEGETVERERRRSARSSHRQSEVGSGMDATARESTDATLAHRQDNDDNDDVNEPSDQGDASALASSTDQARVQAAISNAIEQSERKARKARIVRKELSDGTMASVVSNREIVVSPSRVVKGGYVLQRDFDLHTQVKKEPWEQLSKLPPDPYKPPVTDFVKRDSRVDPVDLKTKGIIAIRHKGDFTVPIPKPGEEILKPLPFLPKERPDQGRPVPGDLARIRPSKYTTRLTAREASEPVRRFLKPHEWQHILDAAKADHAARSVRDDDSGGRRGTSATTTGTAEGAGSKDETGGDNASDEGAVVQRAFLTEDPDAVDAAEAEAEVNKERPWLNKGGGTWRPRPSLGAHHPKSLKVKPKFDPSSYLAKMKERQQEDAEHRMTALIAGRDVDTDPTQWKLRYRERTDGLAKAARARSIRPQHKWDTAAVTRMLDDAIKTEGYKLQALDQLLMDITKGRRSNEASAQQKVVPTREYIHKVRQRISDLRDAASFVRKPTWHEDIKSLRIGGTHGTPLDDFLKRVKAIVDEDNNIVDDTPE
eukprot:m.17101 g.17101  ORF g.17101 m.17101 type:complete len:701 (+) comp3456_c0_seq1:41-2143(+)